MPAPISAERRRRFLRLVEEGSSISAAARRTGVSYAWGRAAYKGYKGAYEEQVIEGHLKAKIDASEIRQRPYKRDELCPEALRALDDFDYFRARYLGRVTLPWHVQAANDVLEALSTPHREFVVMNMPPGTGKTTLNHDIAAWLIARNRRIRIVFGSRTAPNARRQTRRLRRTFERVTPVRAKPEDLEDGTAVDATGVLALDFGIFRPPDKSDIWSGDEFVVMQEDEQAIDEKEPTVSTVGQDTGFLGNRYDAIFWDDVVDSSTIRTLEALESQREWWDGEAESRLEPRGALFLVGQRFAANDLYRYNLDKRLPLDDETLDDIVDLSPDEIDALESVQPTMYRHIVFQAHDDSNCRGEHSRSASPWPTGCVLDPKRVSWRDINRLRVTKPKTYSIQYQQLDDNPENVLINPVWVSGGTDPDTGTIHAGCWDENRGVAELPEGLKGPLVSVGTVDPSPSKWWAIQWWVWAPNAFNQLFLMDTMRRKMGGNELLDYRANEGAHFGVMEDWQNRSEALGLKISHWIVEVNAAQKFMLQYDHTTTWQRKHHVHLMPHTTTILKQDSKLGIDMVKDWWTTGRVRLPGRTMMDRHTASILVNEVTRYPNAGSDDQVMAHWFLTANMNKLQPHEQRAVVQNRPAFVRNDLANMRLVSVR